MEFIKTNILGSENLINACLDSKVKKVIFISTDKASCPVNLYGASKLCSEKLFVAANHIVGKRDLNFSVVRYGNVMGSRFSNSLFLKFNKKGGINITNPNMTRFNILIEESVEMVYWAIKNSIGGEIFVPKLPSYSIKDLADAIGPSCKKKIIGIRAGEKIHEEMISESDSYYTYDIGKYFLIIPSGCDMKSKYGNVWNNARKISEGVSYNSGNNDNFLNIEELRNLIKLNIDSEFKPK